MRSQEEVYTEIIRVHEKLDETPPGVHLFCPKVNDDDDEDYDSPEDPGPEIAVEEKKSRIEDAARRLQLVSWASLILGIDEDQAAQWRPEWVQRTEIFLTKCDGCIRAWHMNRKALRSRFLKEFDEETANIMETRLQKFDKARIDRGLATAADILEKNGPMSSIKLLAIDESATLAFYEALCCVSYLGIPEHRPLFNTVFQKTQEKKPLKVGTAVIPTMTVFLFEEDPLRNQFAKTAWSNIPAQSMTAAQFDWAVNEYLAAAIDGVNQQNTPYPQIRLFWEGILTLLGAMSEDLIVHSLRGMEVQPDIFNLATHHLVCDDDQILASIIKTFSALLDKSSKAFWDALSLLNPPQLPMHISRSPAFEKFLGRSMEESMQVPDGTSRQIPILADFVRALMESLPPPRRTDVCDAMLPIFLGEPGAVKPNRSRAAQVTSVLAGLTSLQLTLNGFLDSGAFKWKLTIGSFPFVNQTINLAAKYKDVINGSIRLKREDRYNIGLSKTALSIVELALSLDARAIREEWRTLEQDTLRVPDVVGRRSAQLWRGFVEVLLPGNMSLARAMLASILPLRGIQKFFPSKDKRDVDGQSKKRFNEEFGPTAEAIGLVLMRVSEFYPADLKTLCSDAHIRIIDPIVAALIHGDESIREAGAQVIASLTGEVQRSQSIVKMVNEFPDTFLMSFSDNVDKVTLDSARDPNFRLTLDPWPPMQSIQVCSRDILNALCDTTQGLLRLRGLTGDERRAVRHWWTQTWKFVDYSFQRMRDWSANVKTAVLEDYCRDVTELADSLLAQHGLIASALAGSNDFDEPTSSAAGAARLKVMQEVLDAPQKYSGGFIEMIQLKDIYLLGITVDALVKLFTRLQEYDMVLPKQVLEVIRRACKSSSGAPGKYALNTNLDDMQRAELLKALGEDDSEVEVEIISSAVFEKSKTKDKKQSSLEAWSRGSSAGPSRASTPGGTAQAASAPRPGRDIVSELTPNAAKYRATLEKIKKPTLKAETKTLTANRQAILESRAREKALSDKTKAEAVARAKALREAATIVSGEGSGLAGITGAIFKDHAPKKSDLMVDSSSEDDDDSEDADATLALLGEKNLDVEKRKQMARRQMSRGPVKKVRLQRSAKDRLARVTPPMGRLHQAILEWDIFHEGKDPPNGYKCEFVANVYPSPMKYKDTFFPLLIYEAWRSFVTAKDESTAKPFGIKVMTRMSVDNFLEVSTLMPIAAGKERGLSEGDIVLLSKATNPLKDKGEPHCLARIWKTTFKKDNLEVAYRLNSRGNQILPVLLPGAEFHAVKITNMTTIEREFAALESLQHYDLMDEVMKAEPSPMLRFGDQLINSIQQNYNLNRGQAVAILNAKENDGFTLVQGPPGTGKTKTIVAMVGALLTGVMKSSTATAIGRPAANGTGGTAKKLLVCAPSNAAVDELVLRLKSGVRDTNGNHKQIKVLRLGRSDAISAAVKDVTLDELVKEEMERLGNKNGEGKISDREKLHQRAGEIKMTLVELNPALEAARCGEDHDVLANLQRQFDKLKSEQRSIGAQIDRDKDSGNTFAREAEIKRRQVQQRILNEAHVLCATLSGSGHEMFKNLDVEFETVIIDEAAQCVELSALIPLKYGCAKCVLVGDPKQLPPTVLSQSAAEYGYDQSLFVRMQRNHPKYVHLLDTQYRMHPEISLFPSKEFYEELLVDGPDMAGLRTQPWHDNPVLGPYRFFDVEGVQEKGHRGQSLVNTRELQVAMQLYGGFRSDYKKLDLTGKIGIITPYKAQLFALRQRFTQQYGEDITQEIEFNTTDAFQGRECEIIIFSCVRASPTGGIGFMTDIRRMNVGLTRAKSSLWILGDSRALRQGEFWNKLIQNAKARDRYTPAQDLAGLLNAPGSVAPPRRSMPPRARQEASTPSSSAFPPSRSRNNMDKPLEEVADMPSGPAPRGRQSRPPSQLPGVYNVMDKRIDHRIVHGAPPVLGINERGEPIPVPPRASAPPVIHSSSDDSRDPSANFSGLSLTSKRSREGGEQNLPPLKRHARPNNQPPSGPRALSRTFGPRPPKAPPRPVDPSAMEVLGLPSGLPQAPSRPGGGGPNIQPANYGTGPARSSQSREPNNAYQGQAAGYGTGPAPSYQSGGPQNAYQNQAAGHGHPYGDGSPNNPSRPVGNPGDGPPPQGPRPPKKKMPPAQGLFIQKKKKKNK